MEDRTSCRLSRLEIKTLEVMHTLYVPMTLLEAAAPFVSPWFSYHELSRQGIYFRVGMDNWSSSSRPVWLQSATEKEMTQFKTDPYLKTLPDCPGKRMDVIIVGAKVSLTLPGSEQAYDLTMEQSTESKTYIISMGCFSLGSISKSWAPNWKESEASFAISIDLIQPVVQRGPAENDNGSVECACKILQQMRKDVNLFYDTKIKVKSGIYLRAHKCVLIAHSETFKSMFEDKKRIHEKTALIDTGNVEVFKDICEDVKKSLDKAKVVESDEIEILDFPGDVVNTALKFMYGEDISKSEPSMLVDLVNFAAKYKCHCMRSCLENMLVDNSSAVDVFELLRVADTHSFQRLRSSALQLIANNPNRKDFIHDDVLKDISATHPHVLCDLLRALV